MILHELLGKSVYVPSKPKPKKRPTTTKKPVENVNTKNALNRVKQQLRRDNALARIKNTQKVISKPKKAASPEEQKILDRMKEIEEMQKQHEKKK